MDRDIEQTVDQLGPPFEYTAKQIIESLLQAIRNDESDIVQEGLIGLLMIHYPDEFQRLDIAVRLAAGDG